MKYHRTVPEWTKIGGPQAGTITALAINPDDRSSLYIGTMTGFYRSINGAGGPYLAWERLPTAPIGIICLALSPNYTEDHALIAGTSSGIYLSRDSGSTWRSARMAIANSVILCISFSSNYLSDGMIMAGTLEDGIFYSEDRGDTWVNKGFGLLDLTVYSLAISPNLIQDGLVYAGTETALYHSYNCARAWRPLNFPEDATPVLSLAISPNFINDHTLFAGSEKNGLYRSFDKGTSWKKLEFPATSISVLLFSHDGKILSAATDTGIFQTTDMGEHWNCLVEFLGVISMVIKEDRMIAGVMDQGVWWKADHQDWNPISNLFAKAFVGFSISPQFEKDNIAFMYGPQEGVWRTVDGGKTWRSLNDDMPFVDINDLVLSTHFYDDQIVVATSQSGVMVSKDTGTSWKMLDEKPSGSVSVSPDGRLLCVSSPGGGICAAVDWKDAPSITWLNVPGPWDTGGSIKALSVTNNMFFHVAVLEGIGETMSIWQGKPNQFEKICSFPITFPPVISFWTPSGPALDKPWFASTGNKVWKFTSRSGDRYIQSDIFAEPLQSEQVLSLKGVQMPTGLTLFACNGKHLYQSMDAKSWTMVYDFQDDFAISIALSPFYTENKTVYALLLGGILSSGTIR